MSRGTEMIVGEHGPDGSVHALVIVQRIGPPALNGGLGSHPLCSALAGLTWSRGADLWGWRLGHAQRRTNQGPPRARRPRPGCCCNRGVDVSHLVGAEGAVLIVEAVCSSVGRRHVEFHQVDVLADDVGRSPDLKIIYRVIIRDKVGVPVLDEVLI